jgi:hypothetical protein
MDSALGSVRMSALGHKRTLKRWRLMSALPPKADMVQQGPDVRLVPKAPFRTVVNWSSLIYELPADLPAFRKIEGSDFALGGRAIRK